MVRQESLADGAQSGNLLGIILYDFCRSKRYGRLEFQSETAVLRSYGRFALADCTQAYTGILAQNVELPALLCTMEVECLLVCTY